MNEQPNIILKITLFNHIRVTFGYLLIFAGLIFAIQYTGGIDFSNIQIDLKIIIAFLVLFVLLALITLPALFLHIDYTIRNRQEEYEIRNKKIIRRKNGIENVYNVEDIGEIYLYHHKVKTNFERYPWSHYHFAKIEMKSGEILYLTHLLYPSGIEKILDKYIKVSYWSVKWWFPTTLCCPPSDMYNEDEFE